MKLSNKLTALVLAACCVAPLAGCQSEDTTWIAKFGDTTVPAGVHLSHLVTAYSSAVQQTGNSEDVLKEEIDGVSASQWISDLALDYTREYIAAEQKFDELGLTISQEDQDTAAYMVEYQWSYLEDLYTENGVAKSSLELSFLNSVKKNNIFKSFYYEGGSKEVPQEELTKYYNENYIRTQYIAFSKKDSTNTALLEGEALEEVKNEAQSYYDRAVAGENFAQLLYDYRVSKASEGTTVDPLESDDQYDQIASRTASGYPETYLTTMFEAQVGTPLFFEDDDYYFVALRKDLMGDGEDFTSRKGEIISALRSDEFTETLSGWADELEGVTWNQAALDRYTPDKVKYN